MSPKSSYFGGGESFLQNLFTYFSYFAFDKAKEQADKEKDISKNQTSPVWITLLSCISQLAGVEKLYMNLIFLTPKGFLRKESSVRLTYEALLTELVEVEKRKINYVATNSSSTSSKNVTGTEENSTICSEGVLLHISSHLMFFIQARLLMLSFYEKLISCSAKKFVDYGELLQNINDIIKKNSSSFHHPVLTPIKTTFTYESEITSHLLGALKSMQEYQFLPSLLHLHDAHSKLHSWQSLIQNKESKKYTFGSSFLKASAVPALYQWLWSAKASFVSKFSLYFYNVLNNQAPSAETRAIMARLSIDYVSKIQAFQKRCDALSICLILKTSSVVPFSPSGYTFPGSEGRLPSGIDSYPAIFAYPSKPDEYWPSIVMQVSDRKLDEAYDKVVTIQDPKIGTTFFICTIESNIFGVVLFEGKRPEKENMVKEFLLDLALQLRCNKVFAGLKPN